MKLNVIPNDKFIGNLEYASVWFQKLRHGKFVIDVIPDSPTQYVGSFIRWLDIQFKRRNISNFTPMWSEIRALVEAYPNIEKFEFVEVSPESMRDMCHTLTTICEILKEVELEPGTRIECNNTYNAQ